MQGDPLLNKRSAPATAKDGATKEGTTKDSATKEGANDFLVVSSRDADPSLQFLLKPGVVTSKKKMKKTDSKQELRLDSKRLDSKQELKLDVSKRVDSKRANLGANLGARAPPPNIRSQVGVQN